MPLLWVLQARAAMALPLLSIGSGTALRQLHLRPVLRLARMQPLVRCMAAKSKGKGKASEQPLEPAAPTPPRPVVCKYLCGYTCFLFLSVVHIPTNP